MRRALVLAVVLVAAFAGIAYCLAAVLEAQSERPGQLLTLTREACGPGLAGCFAGVGK